MGFDVSCRATAPDRNSSGRDRVNESNNLNAPLGVRTVAFALGSLFFLRRALVQPVQKRWKIALVIVFWLFRHSPLVSVPVFSLSCLIPVLNINSSLISPLFPFKTPKPGPNPALFFLFCPSPCNRSRKRESVTFRYAPGTLPALARSSFEFRNSGISDRKINMHPLILRVHI